MNIKITSYSSPKIGLQEDQIINRPFIRSVDTLGECSDDSDKSKSRGCCSHIYTLFSHFLTAITTFFKSIFCCGPRKESKPVEESDSDEERDPSLAGREKSEGIPQSDHPSETLSKRELETQISDLISHDFNAAKAFVIKQERNIDAIFEIFIDQPDWRILFEDVWPELNNDDSISDSNKAAAFKYAMQKASNEQLKEEQLENLLSIASYFLYEELDTDIIEIEDSSPENLFAKENCPIERWLIHRFFTDNPESKQWCKFALSIMDYLKLKRTWKEETSLQFVLKTMNRVGGTELSPDVDDLAIKLINLRTFDNAGILTHQLVKLFIDTKIRKSFFYHLNAKLDFSQQNTQGMTPLAVILQEATKHQYPKDYLELACFFIQLCNASPKGIRINNQELLSFAKNSEKGKKDWEKFAKFLEGGS